MNTVAYSCTSNIIYQQKSKPRNQCRVTNWRFYHHRSPDVGFLCKTNFFHSPIAKHSNRARMCIIALLFSSTSSHTILRRGNEAKAFVRRYYIHHIYKYIPTSLYLRKQSLFFTFGFKIYQYHEN